MKSEFCRTCQFPFDEENTVIRRKTSGAETRVCRNCVNWRKRLWNARRLGLSDPELPAPPPEYHFFEIPPHERMVDHSRCKPGGPMCDECEALWTLVQSSESAGVSAEWRG